MKVIKTIIDIIKKVEYVLLALMLGVIVAATFLQVIGRYTPLPFSSVFEELSTFLFVWMSMIGAGACVRDGSHMCMDFVVSFLPENKKIYSKLLNDLVAIFIGVVIVYCASLLIPRLQKTGMLSAAMQLPLWINNLAAPTGGVLIAFWGIHNVVLDIYSIVTRKPLQGGTVSKED